MRSYAQDELRLLLLHVGLRLLDERESASDPSIVVYVATA
jgi:hypothetical protein